ncbi:hypothetical protein CRR07_22880 [Salmonella enterica subsp. enterica serovar Montevideo]|nr:hypothetical protein [Salmonella enterica]EDM3454280.1 hypothetical protein [Salmonella enterica subsp. enterica serovar Montevideo]ECR9187061.1 hypothetical protein [Salmonella enterica]EEN9822038.1 hypothetical protein [Salmonella enterica]EFS8829725.1 hypothetical protein [Salmonella enterica]
MSSTQDVLFSLKNKTITLGWDVVVAYDRNKVNQLFEQQYVEKVFNNQGFGVINESIKSGLNTISLNNIKFGPPKISFENSKVEDSVAKAKINFISGTIITQEANGRVVSREVITPTLGYSLELSILLEQAKGTVNKESLVQVNFEKSSLLDIQGINNPPLEVMEYFRTWLKNNAVSYTLGVLNLDGAGILTPQEFRIRTQPAPGATLKAAKNYGDGAVLLFITTKYSSKLGELPTNGYPYLLPDEHSCAVVLSSRVLFEHYFLTPFKKSLKGATVALGRSSISSDASYLIKVSGKYDTDDSYKKHIETSLGLTHVRGDLYAALNDGHDGTDTNKGKQYSETTAKVDLSGFTIEADVDKLLFGWGRDHNFSPLIATSLFSSWMGGRQWSYRAYDAKFKVLNTDAHATLEVSDDLSVSFNYADVNYKVTYSDDFIKDWWYEEGFKPLADEIARRVPEALKKGLTPNLSDIDLFLAANLLFPNENAFIAKKAYVPGDLVIFGDVNSKKTAFKISPVEPVVAVKGSVQFKTEPATSAKWSVTPALGSIDAKGVYQAPALFDIDNMVAKVTAEDNGGNSASAVITLVPAPVLISPALNLIVEEKSGDTAPVQLKAVFSGETQSVKWSLSEKIGSIDNSGRYTPPATFNKGMKFIDDIVTTEKGSSYKAQLLLQSKNAKVEYNIVPPMVKALKAGQSQTFETVAIDDLVIVDSWVAYPAVGTFSQQEEIEQEDGTYLCKVTWTAPANISENQAVYIQANASTPLRSGYALVELVGK